MNQFKKYLEYSIYLLVFILPFQTRFIFKQGELADKYWEYGTISLYVSTVFLLLSLSLFALYYFKEDLKAYQGRFRLPFFWSLVIGLDIFVFLSIFLAPDPVLALYRYAIFLLGVGWGFLIIKAPFSRVKLFYFFLAGLFFHSCLALFQFLTQSAPASKYLGLSGHDPSELGVSVVEAVGRDGLAERWLRAYGGLDHPNILGGVLVVALLLLLGLFSRNYFKSRNARAVGYLTFLVFFSALLFSFSRTAVLALLAGVLIFLAGKAWQGRWPEVKRSLGALGLALIVSVVFLFSYQNLIDARLGGGGRLELKSSQERAVHQYQAGELFQENYLLGVGIGNYTLALSESGQESFSWNYQPVHNTFLLVLTEVGIFAFVFFISIPLYLFFKSFRQGNIFNLAILTSLVIMLMFDHWWWSLYFGVLFFWMLLALIYGNLKEKPRL